MEAITAVRVRDYIIKNIRRRILSGDFPAGMRLAQEELAADLGVSRIPVREALQILEEQGVVERLPSRHMVVAEITECQFHQIFQTIGGLQQQFGRFILESDRRDDFRQAIESWSGRGEMEFHRFFAEYLDNGYLSRQFQNMLDTYVDFACGLPGADDGKTGALLIQLRDMLSDVLRNQTESEKAAERQMMQIWEQFERYYEQLEHKVAEERKRHIC